jgi:hypothetical protein
MFHDFDEAAGRHGVVLPITESSEAGSVADVHGSAIAESQNTAQRNFHAPNVNVASTRAVTINILGPDRVAIDMASAARGAAIVAEMQRRERRQDIEDIIADTLWDAEDGSMGHRRLAEAVLAELIRRGLDVFALDAT